MIERTLPWPLGKMRIASGTHDRATLAELNLMIDALKGSVPPRWDILQALASGGVPPLYALTMYKQHKLENIPLADVLPLLAPAWEEWLSSKTYSPEYVASIGSTLRGLQRHGSEATLAAVPKMLRSYRDECKKEAKHVQFNRAKAHVLAFVRDTLKRRHELYSDVQDVPNLKVEGKPTKRPQRPDHLAAILTALPHPHRRMAWEMALTGMGPKEYWGKWEQKQLPVPHVHILGTKRASRVRRVPLWAGQLEGPSKTRSSFEGVWERRLDAEDAITVYDLRRSFAVWLAEADVPQWRQPIYMGHSAVTQTAQYQESELLAWLDEDGDRLYAYAGVIVDQALQEIAA